MSEDVNEADWNRKRYKGVDLKITDTSVDNITVERVSLRRQYRFLWWTWYGRDRLKPKCGCASELAAAEEGWKFKPDSSSEMRCTNCGQKFVVKYTIVQNTNEVKCGT